MCEVVLRRCLSRGPHQPEDGVPVDVFEREETVVGGLVDCDGMGVDGESRSTDYDRGRPANLESVEQEDGSWPYRRGQEVFKGSRDSTTRSNTSRASPGRTRPARCSPITSTDEYRASPPLTETFALCSCLVDHDLRQAEDVGNSRGRVPTRP